MVWLAHESGDCTGRWTFSAKAQAIHCTLCGAWHQLNARTARAYASWKQAEWDIAFVLHDMRTR